MGQTKSSKVIFATEVAALVGSLGEKTPDLQPMAIGPLDDLINVRAEHFPYTTTFDAAAWNPILVLHSSGSTRMPKPVVMRHGTFAVLDNDRHFPEIPGRKNFDMNIWNFDGTVGRVYEPFPPFHLAGFFQKIMVPLYMNTIPIFGPATRPPSGSLVAEIMRHQKPRALFLPPSIAEQMLQETNGLDLFRGLDVFCYAGGPLSQSAGDEISKVIIPCQFYGSTELGQVRQLIPKGEDWSYMEFHPMNKIELRAAEDDAYELVVFVDKSTESSECLNYNLPDVREWHTKDLFRPHPTNHNLWKFHGRRDDIVVLSTGEKLNPVPMETIIQGSHLVAGALVLGQSRTQTALLIEPSPNCNDTHLLLEKVWPLVEIANTKVPGHGRVTRSMMLAAKSEKPFVRAGKGTIVRRLTEEAYMDEIEYLYVSKGKIKPIEPILLEAKGFRLEDVTALVRSTIEKIARGSVIQDTDNLYIAGVDSLKTAEITDNLRSSLSAHRNSNQLDWISPETVYNNPSITELSIVILAFLNDGKKPSTKDRAAEMSRVFEAFAERLLSTPLTTRSDQRCGSCIIGITGTTGQLGTCLLEECIKSPNVSYIYCLNRSPHAGVRWSEMCQKRGLDDHVSKEKVQFLTTNFGKPCLGLDGTVYTKFTNECDILIHNAWKVDFNQSLSSFEENIHGVVTLANWSAAILRSPRIAFISSISSAGPWSSSYREGLNIPEAPISDFKAALDIGYGESKNISERLLDRAAAQSRTSSSVYRVGQIGGSIDSNGILWAKHDWVPAMLQSSRSMESIPADLPRVDWIPIDAVAKIILELSLHDREHIPDLSKYYNIVNPHPVPWSAFLDIAKDQCGPRTKAVPLADWMGILSTSARTDVSALIETPALKSFHFFQSMASRGTVAKYETTAARKASKTMAALEPVTHSIMQTWLNQCLPK